MNVLATTALLLTLGTAASAAPVAGHYGAELCVTQAEQSPNCGPAQARLDRGGRVQVRVSDIVYRLQLRSSQAEVLLMHGSMQIDEFSVADAYLFTVTNWTAHTGIDISGMKNLSAFQARMAARPAVQAAMKAEGLLK